MLTLVGLNTRSALWSSPIQHAARRCAARLVPRRNMTTIKTSVDEAEQVLVAQRKHRPVSPHLTIYQPQLTWYLSSLHRVTGVFLGFGFFGVVIAFGVSTLFGLGLTTDKLAQYYHEKVPKWADITLKGSGAYLLAFHFSNGIRHLIWDAGKALSLKGVYSTGYAVLAFTAVVGTYLFAQ
ncbi:LAMI_0G05468g1_1 [Lachancea mirantina]|uniref:LAMI_0G05468g1_1 n=1 Tax=Lachancea mirantina TaxID=1230905 RepID=A0A1G4K8T3_9SACH|nr:LAMI_0G05468g1_1 [Lachancea mirantina]